MLAAVVERADAVGAVYARQIAELRETMRDLLGLAAVVGAKEDFYPSWVAPQTEVKLPGFGLPSVRATLPKAKLGARPATAPVITVTEVEAKAAAAPWRELVGRWTRDARAAG